MYPQKQQSQSEKLQALKTQAIELLDSLVDEGCEISHRMIQMQILLIDLLEVLCEPEEPE